MPGAWCCPTAGAQAGRRDLTRWGLDPQGSPEASISILLNCPSHSEPEDPCRRDTRNWSPHAGGGGLVVQGGMQTRAATMEKGLRKFNRVTLSLDPRELNAEMQASAYVHRCRGWREPSAHHWMKG